MRFCVLGTLRVLDGSREVTPSAPKLRQVLTFLLLRRNNIVQTTELIDELWGENPPSSALSTLQTYIYKLRKILSHDEVDSFEEILQTQSWGYMLTIDHDQLDLNQFERLLAEGVAALKRNETEMAAKCLAEALSLWRGLALADVAAGNLLSAYVASLEESRLRALELRIESDLRLGRHREVVGELKHLISVHPLHEAFYAQLMNALHRSGRRWEALEVYQRLRATLVEEVGIEPSADTQRLHQSLLSEETTAHPAKPEPQAGHGRRSTAVIERPRNAVRTLLPAQLPPDIWDFTGRQSSINDLVAAATMTEPAATTPPTVLIAGMPGVGKTALAVHLAHLIKRDFPDGQFYCTLRGSDGEPADPGQVLYNWLIATDMYTKKLPGSTEERSKMFRSWCSAHRVLIVLDNAASAAQISPLLPGSEHCTTIITSRSGLYGFPCRKRLDLAPLTLEEGVRLLGAVAGRQRIEREKGDAQSVVRFCEGLPLAVRAAGARLTASPTLPLRTLAARLADPELRLKELNSTDFDIYHSFDLNYQELDPRERGALWLLYLRRSTRFNLKSAAETVGCDIDTSETILTRLVSAHFLRIVGYNGARDDVVYAINELAHLYAEKKLENELAERGTPAEASLDAGETTAIEAPAGSGPPAAPGRLVRRDLRWNN
ncbi:AfsR/SARP family transcriptional regulator [Nonomuraea sp. KC401]|uniref:AfsR/SARP family transcriptional regulator n=1 Tax=unclassified Nonomuraea TaxID=2593643 RepID=UPI0010FDB42E|nr:MULTISPECIES: AfsR/SARP family transcriptional regulator [unclassified Nonomuraea]TLF76990.1 AfsR/SARP family transcriptional regulator [Nonomuraea sp. KC401]